MLAEWSAECSPDDPILVVPWADPANPESHFVDLREHPYDLDHLPEAEHFPALMHALRALNAARSPLFTAKCDAWVLEPEELDQLRINLDLDLAHEPLAAPFTDGFASYIDILLRDRSRFLSVHHHQQFLDRLVRRATPLDHPCAMLDCIIRPAFLDLTGPQEGFSITLYVKALGPDADAARYNWSTALEAVVALLRSKDLL
jgi:hypothetical protein